MSRKVWLLLAFVFGAVACGGPGAETTSEPPAGTVSEAAAVIGSTPPTSLPDGIVIPNVSFTLADGSTLDLAEVDTPMLLVFWAEW